MAKSFFSTFLSSNEYIVWKGKPEKKTFYLRTIFNKALPFCIAWFLFDILFFGDIAEKVAGAPYAVLFPIFHMAPIWIYLANILTMFLRYRNTEYLLTNKYLYVSGGVFAREIQIRPIYKLLVMRTRVGRMERRHGVGSIQFGNNFGKFGDEESHVLDDALGKNIFAIEFIPDYEELMQIIRNLHYQKEDMQNG